MEITTEVPDVTEATDAAAEVIDRSIECLDHYGALMDDGRLYCPSVWDGWGCWNHTLAGTRAVISCPADIPGFDPNLHAYRDCNSDGTWWLNPHTNKSWSNYTPCINALELERNKQVIQIYIIGYSISMTALAISLAIFVAFRRQLNCERVTLHKHLFSCYFLSDLAWILYYSLVALDPDVIDLNPVWCRILHAVTQYFVASNYFWMFGEGLYLHTIIVVAFTSGKMLLIICYFIGWGVPVVTTLLYATIRSQSEMTDRCWLMESDLQWIVAGPIVATLVANFIFLCNIIRVLVTKLRAVNSPDTCQARKAVRAALILIPLLGVQYILFPIRPPEGAALEKTYLTAIALVTSLQGLFVAFLFCFLNGEVIGAISRRWQAGQLEFSVRRKSSAVHSTVSMVNPPGERRGTTGSTRRHQSMTSRSTMTSTAPLISASTSDQESSCQRTEILQMPGKTFI